MQFNLLHKPLPVKPCLLVPCLLVVMLTACVPLPPQPTVAVTRKLSPNFDERRPNFVIIHHTSNNTLAEALRTLSAPERKVSAHYLISRDGKVIQLVEENTRAWHAGKSWWGGHTDINSASLGIELDNNGEEPFADAQIDALLALLTDIQQRYNIPAANFIGHADIAPARKRDPSIFFPWKKLASQGFGLWCDTPLSPTPTGFDQTLALAAIGYNPAFPEASRHAFLQHFAHRGQAASSEDENALIFCLWQKKANQELIPPLNQ